MINQPISTTNVPAFASSGSRVQPDGITYAVGYVSPVQLPAEHLNWFLAGLTANGVTEQTAINNVIHEIDDVLAAASITPDGSGSSAQLLAAIQALCVLLAGNQTIGGIKTFSSAIIANLTGNSDTATKGSSVVETGASTQMFMKVFNIGDWNMQSSSNKSVAHGLTLSKIRTVEAVIRNDADTLHYPIHYNGGDSGNVYGGLNFDSTNVNLWRWGSGGFAGATFSATSYNRGWITAWYTA